MPAAPTRRAWLWGALGAAAVCVAVVAVVVVLALIAAHRVLSQPIPTQGPLVERAALRAPAPDAAEAGADQAVAISALAAPEWVAETAERLDIPERALAAYAGAALAAAQEHPECNLAWNTLAGIGAVESVHGAIHGSAIGDDGVAAPAIIGIALDGDGVQNIADTDQGRLDGDAEHDRAVGPMQFIPETWRIHGRDGSGDGTADPQNIDDAALTAADYLCRAGDLSDPDAWIAAVHSYNPTVEYNNRVASAADRYAE